MSVQAYDMHANWREVSAHALCAMVASAREIGKKVTVTPYARDRGFRSFIVSWPSNGCEGHLYVVRVRRFKSN